LFELLLLLLAGASVVYAAALLKDRVAGVIAENPVAHPERFISEHIEKARKVLCKKKVCC
jgi:hypothetical protein